MQQLVGPWRLSAGRSPLPVIKRCRGSTPRDARHFVSSKRKEGGGGGGGADVPSRMRCWWASHWRRAASDGPDAWTEAPSILGVRPSASPPAGSSRLLEVTFLQSSHDTGRRAERGDTRVKGQCGDLPSQAFISPLKTSLPRRRNFILKTVVTYKEG